MRKKIFLRALIVSVLAFLLYWVNSRQLQHAQLHVIMPAKSKVVAHAKKTKEPKTPTALPTPRVNSAAAHQVKAEAGSQKTLTAQIKKAMGNQFGYQVAVQDLKHSKRFARLARRQSAQPVSGIMRFYLLVAVAKEEEKGKLGARTVIKIHPSDRQKGEKKLRPNMGYGIQYLRQAMMRGDQTAANALLRKVGISQVNKVIQQLGAKDTRMLANFKESKVGETTANDLVLSLQAIYQGRVLNRQYAYQVFGAMHGQHSSLVKEIKGSNCYDVGDGHAAMALVQDPGHAYCLCVCGNSAQNLPQLGRTVARFFNKKH